MIIAFPDPKFEIKVNPPAAEIHFNFKPTLFNLPEYISLHKTDSRFSFYLVQKRSELTCGLFHVFLDNECAKSPFRAPYGAPEFSPEVDLNTIEAFLKAVQFFLLERKVTQSLVVAYPFCYAPEQSAMLTNAFLQLDYSLEFSQLNHYLPVTEEVFETHLHHSERRRLAKCRKHGFNFQQEEADFLPQAYAFIKTCREQKKKPLSLSETQLHNLFTAFPDRYFIFSVKKESELIAVTICVKVSDKILLTAYPASPYEYNTFSPSVMLNEGLYRFCQENKYQFFDLGISGTKEDPHYSLMKYKERLGAIPSLKLTFSWHST